MPKFGPKSRNKKHSVYFAELNPASDRFTAISIVVKRRPFLAIQINFFKEDQLVTVKIILRVLISTSVSSTSMI